MVYIEIAWAIIKDTSFLIQFPNASPRNPPSSPPPKKNNNKKIKHESENERNIKGEGKSIVQFNVMLYIRLTSHIQIYNKIIIKDTFLYTKANMYRSKIRFYH